MSLRVALLLAVLAAPALAGGPSSWTVEGEPPEAPDAWRPGLWLPQREGQTAVLDALGRHAAIREVPTARLVVSLDRVLPAGASAPELDWRRPTLEPPGGPPLALLDDPVAWQGEASGPTVGANADATVVSVRLPFALPAGPIERLTLTVPVLDGAPILLRFATWDAVVKDAERELADWRTHCVARAAISAIQPYLDCAAYRSLQARGDTLLAALLLRELSRDGADGVLPRFVALKALSDTAWGKQQQVPASGDEAAVARVLKRWKALGHPSVPGATPFEKE